MNKNNYKIINCKEDLISNSSPSFENKQKSIETIISQQTVSGDSLLSETKSINGTPDTNSTTETTEKVIELKNDSKKSKNTQKNENLSKQPLNSHENQRESSIFTLSYNDLIKKKYYKQPHPEWIEYPPDSGNYIKTFGVVWNLIHQTNCLTDYLTSEKVRYMEYFYSTSFSNTNSK